MYTDSLTKKEKVEQSILRATYTVVLMPSQSIWPSKYPLAVSTEGVS
jgi:predicted RecB family nuclease